MKIKYLLCPQITDGMDVYSMQCIEKKFNFASGEKHIFCKYLISQIVPKFFFHKRLLKFARKCNGKCNITTLEWYPYHLIHPTENISSHVCIRL